MDYIAAIDNGVINLINIIPNTWNSGVADVEAMQKGGYFEGHGQEFYQMGVGIKDYTVNSWKNSFSTPIDEQMTHTWNQIKDPQTTEFASTLFFGSKIPMKYSTYSIPKINLTTNEGFLFRGFTVKAPFDIPVQRFGNMNITRTDYWGLRIGTNNYINRTFVAIKPNWNPLTQYTTGVIPKGTYMRFGIIGPQGLLYPGGSFQFILFSKYVNNQASKTIIR